MLGRSRLSEKLILLTIAFVMLAEAVIFIPSVATFRQDWLEERAESAGLITLAIQGVPNYEGSELLSQAFMEETGVEMVAAETDGMSQLILGMASGTPIIETIDLREERTLPPMGRALSTLFLEREGCLRVIADSPVAGQSSVEYLVQQKVLRDGMWDYFRNILALSVLIALITGTLIYLALSGMIVRPVRQLAAQLVRFRKDPLKTYNFGPPTARRDEIGDLQREFGQMKQDVRSSFRQRDRLAALGLAVAKIQHDLRNILNAAQLVSDRIAMDPDERVAKMGARLERVIDRGIRIATDTLDYTKQDKDGVERENLRIATLMGEIAADTLGGFQGLKFINKVPSDLTVLADPDHTYRLFHNLFRNAGQAMDAMDADAPRELRLSANLSGETAHIHVSDSGPGLPEKTKTNLFKPFAGASGAGSTGLGLSISHELAVEQGGSLDLVKSDGEGTEFRVSLPLVK
jgi:signal transduction histidine kinase